MYILVNKDNVIVGSAFNKPSEACCSKNMQRVFEIPDTEYTPEMIGTKIVSYDTIEPLK